MSFEKKKLEVQIFSSSLPNNSHRSLSTKTKKLGLFPTTVKKTIPASAMNKMEEIKDIERSQEGETKKNPLLIQFESKEYRTVRKDSKKTADSQKNLKRLKDSKSKLLDKSLLQKFKYASLTPSKNKASVHWQTLGNENLGKQILFKAVKKTEKTIKSEKMEKSEPKLTLFKLGMSKQLELKLSKKPLSPETPLHKSRLNSPQAGSLEKLRKNMSEKNVSESKPKSRQKVSKSSDKDEKPEKELFLEDRAQSYRLLGDKFSKIAQQSGLFFSPEGKYSGFDVSDEETRHSDERFLKVLEERTSKKIDFKKEEEELILKRTQLAKSIMERLVKEKDNLMAQEDDDTYIKRVKTMLNEKQHSRKYTSQNSLNGYNRYGHLSQYLALTGRTNLHTPKKLSLKRFFHKNDKTEELQQSMKNKESLSKPSGLLESSSRIKMAGLESALKVCLKNSKGFSSKNGYRVDDSVFLEDKEFDRSRTEEAQRFSPAPVGLGSHQNFGTLNQKVEEEPYEPETRIKRSVGISLGDSVGIKGSSLSGSTPSNLKPSRPVCSKIKAFINSIHTPVQSLPSKNLATKKAASLIQRGKTKSFSRDFKSSDSFVDKTEQRGIKSPYPKFEYFKTELKHNSPWGKLAKTIQNIEKTLFLDKASLFVEVKTYFEQCQEIYFLTVLSVPLKDKTCETVSKKSEVSRSQEARLLVHKSMVLERWSLVCLLHLMLSSDKNGWTSLLQKLSAVFKVLKMIPEICGGVLAENSKTSSPSFCCVVLLESYLRSLEDSLHILHQK